MIRTTQIEVLRALNIPKEEKEHNVTVRWPDNDSKWSIGKNETTYVQGQLIIEQLVVEVKINETVFKEKSRALMSSIVTQNLASRDKALVILQTTSEKLDGARWGRKPR